MNKICVFAGTTEGRTILEFLCEAGADVTACVATEYGQALLPKAPNLKVSAKRLSREEIRGLLRQEGFDLVVDATHPYAASVTENLAEACAEEDVEYLRVLRDGTARPESCVWKQDIEGALSYLAKTRGNILLTTGSKDLARFAALPDFAERVYARVLPMEESLRLCRKAGLAPSHILAMQGPFSEEMNGAMLRFVNASFLVTKDSGKAGGFQEKAAAAAAAGAELLVIGRPTQRAGLSCQEALACLGRRLNLEGGKKLPLAADKKIVTQGFPDESFLRLEGIPMTKSEVRSVILSKLMLREDSVCWDIGAGSGSVAVEMALKAGRGQVYAVERREDAIPLIRENARRLGAGNLTVIEGRAPEILESLPKPACVFIGGSSGNMAEIIESVLAKNHEARIAAAAVTLETLSALTECMRRFSFSETEVVSLSVARSRRAGAWHLMQARNPVYLFVFQGVEAPYKEDIFA
ncbi:MAG: precorrin-6A reductase [Lachnospiraceae bacterium]|nr:precorrin-6A reductase [Lachnospiraceae bacterium]